MGGEAAQLQYSLRDDGSATEWDRIVSRHAARKRQSRARSVVPLVESSVLVSNKVSEQQDKIFKQPFNSGSSAIYNLSERESAHSIASRIVSRHLREAKYGFAASQ